MKNNNYYLGLDIGTDSVGWAVTDNTYSLLKFHGEPAWGTHVFDGASLSDERRNYRSARRRLDRKKQRVSFVQELFATEISKIDKNFFIRIKESQLYRDDCGYNYTIFNDGDYTDRNYHENYPTIHHLIVDLMKSDRKHDVRLVYLAIAWLVSHRGHFLSNISLEHIDDVKNFSHIYGTFMSFFEENGYEMPWNGVDENELSNILRKKQNVSNKTKALIGLLYGGIKPNDEVTEEFPYRRTKIISLLAGGKVTPADLYSNDEYADIASVSLYMADEDFAEIIEALGDDAIILEMLRSIYDWTLLVDSLGSAESISEAKVNVYEQHKKDLKVLKGFVKKYIPAEYNSIFRNDEKDNYVAYSYHHDGTNVVKNKKTSIEEFSKYILKKIAIITPDKCDIDSFNDMVERLQLRAFLPKQKTTDNRVVPHQLYYYELLKIIENAEKYLPFLGEIKDGLSVSDKIKSVFMFRIPYFVGPTNVNSEHAWIVRSGEKIYPWNFNQVVDFDASEQNFIQNMTNTCTYIPGEDVIPKESLLYHKYMVLNEINNIRIDGVKLSVEIKQCLYDELFKKKKKITKKKIVEFLICNGYIGKIDEAVVSGVDNNITSNLSSYIAFKKMLDAGILGENEVEKIIERATYSEDKSRLEKWIKLKFPNIDESDIKYICKLKLKEFGRLSKYFLTALEGVDKETGEVYTIIDALWNTQNNLMELLSDRFTYREEIEKYTQNYYQDRSISLDERMDEMRLSGSVRRSVYRTLDVVKDVEKAFGKPKKIFVEMTRGSDKEQRGIRTKSRKQQILDLYSMCKDEDVRYLRKQLDDMGDYADNRLQGDKLFLYYMQFGKCIYTGERIEIEKLGTKLYDIDHIYPQAFVKDDSIINNKALCLSEENGKKANKYPIAQDVRKKMAGFWKYLTDIGAMSEEKYKRLTRSTPFTEDEKWGFINRQLVETSQANKAIATLLKEKYSDVEIVYSKAKLTSEFRQEYNLTKSRLFNDLHHAVDAYLNIVTGNVYNMIFSRKWFNVNNEYSIKTKTIFKNSHTCGGQIIWEGEKSINKVKGIAVKNNAHFTKFAYFKHGGLFDQMPVKAAEGLTPLKKGMDPAKYGGYNKAGVMFYIPVRYYAGKKTEVIILSVELMHGKRFLSDANFANEYAIKRTEHIIGKTVNRVEFPMGMRPWKVNTVLSLDGFRVCISGISSGGRCLIPQSMMQFVADEKYCMYLKKLEKFVEKTDRNSSYVYCEEYDYISKSKNIELYDLYIDKYQNSIYKKRINAPLTILVDGRDRFIGLDIINQSRALLHIHETFGKIAGGCDLRLIGGAGKAAATVGFSSSMTNWKNKYSNICLIDSSVTGMWEKKSDNLLDLV